MEVGEGASAQALVRRLEEEHPGLFNGPQRLVVAVNGEYVVMGHILTDGDEVALIPPVSGGWL